VSVDLFHFVLAFFHFSSFQVANIIMDDDMLKPNSLPIWIDKSCESLTVENCIMNCLHHSKMPV
jgi:hypothetical protein